MTWDHRPVPDVTPETRPYWEGAAEGVLRLRTCQDCGLTHFPPRSHCPDCFSDDVPWVEASGRGEVYSFTVLRVSHDLPDELLPVVIAYVELDEGPRMMTSIPTEDPEAVRIGSSVEVAFEETDVEEIGIPVFELVD